MPSPGRHDLEPVASACYSVHADCGRPPKGDGEAGEKVKSMPSANVAHETDLDAKSRPCVVVAGSPTELLVRPGYSEGGALSRSWNSARLAR